MRFARPSGEALCLMSMAMACDLTFLVMPLIIGSLVAQHGMTDNQVGFVATAQMLSCALLSFALAPKVRHLNPRATLIAGLLLVALGNFVTLFAHSAPILVPARLSAGIGEALVNVVVGVLIARQREPDRGFALISIACTAGAAVVFLIAPVLTPTVGKDGIFWLLTALPILALPCVFGVQKGSLAKEDAVSAVRPTPFIVTPIAIALLVGIIGFGVSANAIYVFIERIGETVGVSYATMMYWMLWVSIIMVGGPTLAHAVGTRFGRLPMLAIAYIGVGISGPLMGFATTPLQLFIGLMIGGFFVVLGNPFHQGLLAALDPLGRLITLSRGVLAIGHSITPAIASTVLMSGGGFAALGVWSAVAAVVSFGLIYTAARSVDRAAPARAVASLQPG